MTTSPNPRSSVIAAQWTVGLVLVSWRYLWQITPLHRVERHGDPSTDAPPAIPVDQADDRVQLAEDGVGPFFHRLFRVEIVGAAVSASELMHDIVSDFGRFVPGEVITVRRTSGVDTALRLGDEFVIQMPGPWNGPVRVVAVTESVLRLATLRGHLEAGQVQFEACHEGTDLVFEIHAWARPSTSLVRWLYCVLRLAKEIQLNMWVRFCRAAAAQAGGGLNNGVWIQTHELPEHA